MFSLDSKQSSVKPMAIYQDPDVIAGGYTVIPTKFYHPNASRNALGLVGGNEVSLPSGNLVDVESELRGITRDLSKAPAKKYQPSCLLGEENPESSHGLASINGSCAPWPKSFTFRERGSGNAISVSMTPNHLPTSQHVTFPGVPAPKPLEMDVYGSPWRF